MNICQALGKAAFCFKKCRPSLHLPKISVVILVAKQANYLFWFAGKKLVVSQFYTGVDVPPLVEV
jgi:hypothetical protein